MCGCGCWGGGLRCAVEVGGLGGVLEGDVATTPHRSMSDRRGRQKTFRLLNCIYMYISSSDATTWRSEARAGAYRGKRATGRARRSGSFPGCEVPVDRMEVATIPVGDIVCTRSTDGGPQGTFRDLRGSCTALVLPRSTTGETGDLVSPALLRPPVTLALRPRRIKALEGHP